MCHYSTSPASDGFVEHKCPPSPRAVSRYSIFGKANLQLASHPVDQMYANFMASYLAHGHLSTKFNDNPSSSFSVISLKASYTENIISTVEITRL